MERKKWSLNSWKNYGLTHAPRWENHVDYQYALKTLRNYPKLVSYEDITKLKNEIQDASLGSKFILQCGECAETFSTCHYITVKNILKTISQMSIVLSSIGETPIVNIGRIAGQYAKPRSNELEEINSISVPTFKGDIINSLDCTLLDRTPNPLRMVTGYTKSAETLKYIDDILNRQKAESLTPHFQLSHLFTSHEALLLDYEASQTCLNSSNNEWYDTSAHMLWVGERTRHYNGAHIEFLSGIANPIGIKIGPTFDSDEIVSTIRKLNPENNSGKICLITRFGKNYAYESLCKLIKLVKSNNFNVTWLCDPMHGNTYVSKQLYKTRSYEDILDETKQVLKAHKDYNTILGGIHLEITGENATECVDNIGGVNVDSQHYNYRTSCDPCLNPYQAVSFSFELAKLLNNDLK